jgi:cytidine deaminase
VGRIALAAQIVQHGLGLRSAAISTEQSTVRKMDDRGKGATPDKVLMESAKAAASRAYAPYSRFKVGCALRTGTGQIYCGCNVENASYSATLCAERAALAAAVAAEGPTPAIDQLVVYAIGTDGEHSACPPCGICRQVIAEVAPTARIGFFPTADLFVERLAHALLPEAFEGASNVSGFSLGRKVIFPKG